jgi:hypothetical protein
MTNRQPGLHAWLALFYRMAMALIISPFQFLFRQDIQLLL